MNSLKIVGYMYSWLSNVTVYKFDKENSSSKQTELSDITVGFFLPIYMLTSSKTIYIK